MSEAASDPGQTSNMLELSNRLIKLLREDWALKGPIALHEPVFAGNEWKYVKDCLDTGWVSSVGSYVDRFERDFAKVVGADAGIATVNGTAALHAALHTVGVADSDLAICPTLTFIATANAISYCGATPLFADSELDTLGLCPEALERFLSARCRSGANGPTFEGRRIGACVPVHIFGHSARIEKINEVCRAYGIPVVEDSTEALGSEAGGRALGTYGAIGVFSFNGNKIITTGGGGMLVTNDRTLAQRLKHLTTTARTRHKWNFEHDEIGWNYRLPNINAALGCAQLERLPEFTQSKRNLAGAYQERTNDLNDIRFVDEPRGTRSNFWLNAFLLQDSARRDQFLEETHREGIDTRPCWTLMHELAPYRSAPRCDDLRGAREIFDRLVNVPSSATLFPSPSG